MWGQTTVEQALVGGTSWAGEMRQEEICSIHRGWCMRIVLLGMRRGRHGLTRRGGRGIS